MSLNKFGPAMQKGLDTGNAVASSVLALAMLGKVKPADLAEAIADNESLSLYRNDVAIALQQAFVKKAVEDEKEEKARKNSK